MTNELKIERVSGFKKDDRFSSYWDDVIIPDIQCTFWGIDPNGGIHSLLHEVDAQNCAEQTPLIVFRADLVVSDD